MKRSKQNQPTLTASTWREQLGIHIRTPEERKRVANQLGVNPLTLTRWVNNESSPHKSSLQKLLSLLPSHQAELVELLRNEVTTEVIMENHSSVSLSLYTSVLNAYTTAHPTLLFWSISQRILQHMLTHVATGEGTIEIMVAQCMPPARTGKIHSLHEVIRESSRTPDSYTQHQSVFLGAESLAGAALTSLHTKVVYNFSEERSIYPRMLEIGEECSAIACPILYTNRVAGCLLVSSSLPNYFSLQQQQLIERCAELFALAFSHKHFYPFETLDLRPMPAEQKQQDYIASFRKSVSQVMRDAGVEKPYTLLQAEQYVWQQIEEKLLTL